MKKIFCLCFLSFLFSSCNSKAQEVKTITTVNLKTLLLKEKIQLLDVRSPEEIADGFIKTAIFANYFDNDFLAKAIKQLDKSKPVYLYCRSGNRSGKSAKILSEQGFEAYNVLGGFKQWKKENKK